MEDLKIPEPPSQISFSPPLTLTRPLTLIVGTQGHASVFLGSFLSTYQIISTMRAKPEGSQFSIQCGQLCYTELQQQAFLYLRVSQAFPERLSTALATYLFSFNLKEVFIFDTLLSSQVYFESSSIYTIKTASLSASLDSWSAKLPPSVIKEGIVAALLIRGECRQTKVLCINVRVQNRAIVQFQELERLSDAVTIMGGANWALGDVQNVSLGNKVCRELLHEHNQRGSGIYS